MSWNKGVKFKKSNSIISKVITDFRKKAYGKNHAAWKGGVSRNYCYRLMRGKPSICNLCGIKTVVDIDHIDGNSKNNSLNNLQFLCSSCHHKKDNRIKNIPVCRMGVNPSYNLYLEYNKNRNVKTGQFQQWKRR